MNTSPTNHESSTETDADTPAGLGPATGPGVSAGSPADSAGPTYTGPADSAGPDDSTGPADSGRLTTSLPGFGSSFGQHGLSRPVDDRMVAGVAAGIARYLDVDANIVRIAFAVLTFFGGVGVAIYLAGWLVLPEDGTDRSIASDLFDSLENRSR
jgi:phage shock protein PspC (stress-responsive transcriptional regulator)